MVCIFSTEIVYPGRFISMKLDVYWGQMELGTIVPKRGNERVKSKQNLNRIEKRAIGRKKNWDDADGS